MGTKGLKQKQHKPLASSKRFMKGKGAKMCALKRQNTGLALHALKLFKLSEYFDELFLKAAKSRNILIVPAGIELKSDSSSIPAISPFSGLEKPL